MRIDHTSTVSRPGPTHVQVALQRSPRRRPRGGLPLGSDGTVVVGTSWLPRRGWRPAGNARLEHPRATSGDIGSDHLIEIPEADDVPESPSAAVDGLGILNAREDPHDG